MKNKILPLTLIILFVLIFFLFFKGLKNSSIYKPVSEIKKDIPIFKVKIFEKNKNINSNEIFIDDDKVYLINIWASWCVPCIDEHPFLMELTKEKNLELIGLNYKDNDIKAKRFLTKLGNPYSMIFSDYKGTVAINWGAYGVPESFLIKKRKIIKKIIGPINEDYFNEIKKLIK